MISVELGRRSYCVTIERGLLARCGQLLPEGVKRWAILADEQVAKLYGEAVHKAVPGSIVLTFPAGEESKCLSVYETLCRNLLQQGFSRQDGIIALGGGVCGDLAGFVAATLLRGVTLVHLPTTLLAQVDSSIGGKVGIDLPEGKNLLGAFYHPQQVLIDPDCLLSLPARQRSSGIAEMIKYGMIASGELLERLEGDEPDWGALVERCIRIKARIVARDERDLELRHILNFGHTFGHVYEAAGGYRCWTHGEAVAAGMVQMLRWQQSHGYGGADCTVRLKPLLARYGLPADIACSAADAERYLMRDKKNGANGISVVVVPRVGQAEIQTVTVERLLEGWIE